jgi:hypothetical protein
MSFTGKKNQNLWGKWKMMNIISGGTHRNHLQPDLQFVAQHLEY